jgi:hypothetical protein
MKKTIIPPDQLLLERLTEMAATIKIQSPWQVDRNGEPKIFVPAEVLTRWQQLPSIVRERYLITQLTNLLIAIYFHGDEHLEAENQVTSTAYWENPAVSSSTVSALFPELDQANGGSGFGDPNWSVIDRTADGLWQVHKDNLTLYLDPERDLVPQKAITAEKVTVLMPHHIVETGFYIAIGNAGKPDYSQYPSVNLYLNFHHEGAVSVLKAVTEKLNSLFLPFAFRLPYEVEGYNYYDTGILNISKNNYCQLKSTLQEIYLCHQIYFQAGTPLFTKELASGVSIAEVPLQAVNFAKAFAIDRFQPIVAGFLAAWQEKKFTTQSRLEAILQSLTTCRQDLSSWHLEPASEDIYDPWFS